MARYLVNDPDRVDARAKLTTSVISTLIGLQAMDKKYIKASSDASVTVICTLSSTQFNYQHFFL